MTPENQTLKATRNRWVFGAKRNLWRKEPERIETGRLFHRVVGKSSFAAGFYMDGGRSEREGEAEEERRVRPPSCVDVEERKRSNAMAPSSG